MKIAALSVCLLTITLASAFKDLGCYKDAGNRDLPHQTDFHLDNSPAKCVAHCKTSGYNYAAVQYQFQCFCGNNYGKHDKIAESRCEEKPCPGDSEQKCGGSWANRVFATNQYEIGCYKDAGDRDLPHHTDFHSTNSPAKCITHCKSLGKKYAAVQYQFQCFCGDSYGKHDRLANSRCQEKTCPGDSSQKCGGSWANRVFHTRPQEIGCYKDAGDRDLPYHTDFHSTNSPAKCITHCKSHGLKYAAVQYQFQCFCGDSYGKHGIIADGRCEEKACPGDSSDKCGGSWANRVFMVL